MNIRLVWNKAETPCELHGLLQSLGDEYPVFDNGEGTLLRFTKDETAGHLSTICSDTFVDITYSDITTAGRAIANALAGLNAQENMEFETFGIMIDCSRNAVSTVAHIKKRMRQLALMGYNTVMLYTEDTYQLPGEPMFGYRRGAYTMAEIKEIDAYAKTLGITVIGCIETLAHLEHILKHPEYADVRDTDSILMVGEDKTYQLIDKMLTFWKEALSIDRIHVGLDEAFSLGRGNYLKKHGYRESLDIFQEHIEKVCELCSKHELKPMIWSDMYFRFNNPDHAYRQPGKMPSEVVDRIPKDIEMVYWDYYNRDEGEYARSIDQHREIGFEPIMASGLWTWAKLWCDQAQNIDSVKPCLSASMKKGVRELFFTLWGDDGAFCEPDSMLAGLCWSAMLVYAKNENIESLEKVFRVITSSSYTLQMKAAELEAHFENDPDSSVVGDRFYPWMVTHSNSSCYLWDDPVFADHWQHIHKRGESVFDKTVKTYDSVYEVLSKEVNEQGGAGDLRHAALLADFLRKKLRMREATSIAYKDKDMLRLRQIAESEIPELERLCELITQSWTKRWLECYKPFGLEHILNRQGGQVSRLRYLAGRLSDFVDGRIDEIEEL